jgi:hypothetical protein
MVIGALEQATLNTLGGASLYLWVIAFVVFAIDLFRGESDSHYGVS